MKKWIEGILLTLLAAQSLELLWRRLAWAQSPPELPLVAWAALLLVNAVVFGAGVRRLLR